jgi:hypothetical protein
MLYRSFPLPEGGPIHTPAACRSSIADPEKHFRGRHLPSRLHRPPALERGHDPTTATIRTGKESINE